MASGDRCDCCDLPVESCGKAIEKKRLKDAADEKTRLLTLPGFFEARYPGVCGHCGEHFDAGTPIRNYQYGWVCCEEHVEPPFIP